MAAGTRSITVKFDGDASGLTKAASQAAGATDEAAKKTGAMGDKMKAFAGGVVGGLAGSAMAALSSFAGGAVDAFSAVEDATGAANVQFGEAADGVVKFAEAASKAFGMSKQEALDAQNTFGTFGKGAGLAGQDLATFSQDLTGLAGDLASFKGTSTEQAINAIGGALRGENEGMRAFGVLLSADAVAAEALSSGLVKTTKDLDGIKAAQFKAQEAQTAYNKAVKEHGEGSTEATKASIALSAAEKTLAKETAGANPKLTDQQKLMATQSLIFKSTTDAQGDYQRTSSSTANVQKTLAAETLNAQAALGAKLAPAITAVRTLKLALIQTMTGFIEKISSVTDFVGRNKEVFVALGAVIGAIILPALINMGVQAVISAAKSVAASIMAGAAWIAAGAQATLMGIRAAAAWLMALGPIGLIIAGVAAVILVFVKFRTQIMAILGTVWSWITGAVSGVINFIKSHWQLLLAIITGPIGIAVALVVKHFDGIKSAASNIFDAVKSIFAKVKGVITAPFEAAVNAVKSVWNNTVGGKGIHIPSIGIGPFKTPGIDFTIPRLAKGGTIAGAGMAMVGERGPELLSLPRGAQVTPLGGGATVVEIHATGPTLTDIVRVEIRESNRATRNAVRAGASRAVTA